MISNRKGTIFGVQDDPFAAALSEQLISNAYALRTDMTREALFARKDVNRECDYPSTDEMTITDYTEMYNRNPIGTRVVSVMPSECWQVFPQVYEDEDASVTTPFEEAFKKLGDLLLEGEQSYFDSEQVGNPLWEYLARADKLSGIGHFGLILIGIDDGKPLSEPVDGFDDEGISEDTEFINNLAKQPKDEKKVVGEESAKTKKPGSENGKTKKSEHKLLYLSVFAETSVTSIEYNANIHSPRYRKPSFYSIDLGSESTSYVTAGREERSIRVHWSRVVHICDNMDSSEVIGVPRQRPVWNNLLNLVKIYGGDAEGFWKNCVMRIFLETHPQLGGDVELDEDSLRERMFDMENGLQKWAALMGMSAKTIAPSVVDPTSHINVQVEAICIILGIPLRIFKGSERGELASGQDDSTWNDRVRARRYSYLIPRVIVPFVNRLIALGVLPLPKDRYRIDWEDPEIMKPAEKAAIAVQHVDAMSKYIAGGVDVLMDPMDFMTRELDIEDEDAEGILQRAMEAQEEKQAEAEAAQEEAAKVQAEALAAAGAQPPQPGQPPVSGQEQPAAPGQPPVTGKQPVPGQKPPVDGKQPPPAFGKKPAVPVVPTKGGKKPTPAEQKALDEKAKADAEAAKKKRKPTKNTFCPTGKGGGTDPTCGVGGGKRSGTFDPVMVKRKSVEYKKLPDSKKQQVLDAHLKAYEDIGPIYTSTKSPAFKKLGPKQQMANRQIGKLEGIASHYLSTAEAFPVGSDRRMHQHMALDLFEQAHSVHQGMMKQKKLYGKV
jgi:hypothetical protein